MKALLQHIVLSPSQPVFFILLLNAVCKYVKRQFYAIWFDPTGTRTHDIPYSVVYAHTNNAMRFLLFQFVNRYIQIYILYIYRHTMSGCVFLSFKVLSIAKQFCHNSSYHAFFFYDFVGSDSNLSCDMCQQPVVFLLQ